MTLAVTLQVPTEVRAARIADYTGTVVSIYTQLAEVANMYAPPTEGPPESLPPEVAAACILQRMADGIRRSDGTVIAEPDAILKFYLPPPKHMVKFIGRLYKPTQHFVGSYIDMCQHTLHVL